MPWSSNCCSLGWWFAFCLVWGFFSLLASLMCHRTLRVAARAGDGCVLFCQVICEFPLLPAFFPFFYTNMLLARLLSPAPVCPVAAFFPYAIVSTTQSGNYTRKKLKRKKLFLVICLPWLPLCLLCPLALQCGNFQQEEKSPNLSKGIGDHCAPVVNSWAGGWGGWEPTSGEAFSSPSSSGAAAVPLCHTHTALQLEVSLWFCCCPRGSSKATHPKWLGVPVGMMVWLARGTRSSWSRIWRKQAAGSKEDACSPSCRKYLEDIWQPQEC